MARMKLALAISLVVCLFGNKHAMNHHEFNRLYIRLLNDVDTTVKSMVDYVANALVKLGMCRGNDVNKLVRVGDHYDVMISNAWPLLDLLHTDFQDLMIFVNNLESIRHLMKFLYTYFRQSAINIIDHLKHVYELF